MGDTAMPCKVDASSIKAIDKRSVHRICSGQVVLTLATAVKELVENSIDAGATSVEVKLKDYGSESIEVSDNGQGVKEENFEGLALKHHTSKLTDFDDLVNVSTFGFRGEALSSLCALSDMTVTTRHKTVSVGTRLELNVNGKIVNKKLIPKPVGTSVLLQNIFYTLPVRHKEFQRNVKKEFTRLIQVLNAYCIINTGVRISCVNQTSKGNRTAVVSTNNNSSMRENISNVFGSKQLQSLLEFKQVAPTDLVCDEFNIKAHQRETVDFSVTGHVSACQHGLGRSSTDRQFIFINKRPCDSVKIVKLINEVYHCYNRHQYPFVALSVEMKRENVDVNVTPDKRQMFVDGEKMLLAVIKTSLIKIFEPTVSVYKVNNDFLSATGSASSNNFNKSTSLLESGAEKPAALSSSVSSPLPLSLQSCQDNSLSNSLSKLKRNFSSAFDKNKDSPAVNNSTGNANIGKKVKSSSLSSFLHKSKRDASSYLSSPAVTNTQSISNFFTPPRDRNSSQLTKHVDTPRPMSNPFIVSCSGDAPTSDIDDVSCSGDAPTSDIDDVKVFSHSSVSCNVNMGHVEPDAPSIPLESSSTSENDHSSSSVGSASGGRSSSSSSSVGGSSSSSSVGGSSRSSSSGIVVREMVEADSNSNVNIDNQPGRNVSGIVAKECGDFKGLPDGIVDVSGHCGDHGDIVAVSGHCADHGDIVAVSGHCADHGDIVANDLKANCLNCDGDTRVMAKTPKTRPELSDCGHSSGGKKIVSDADVQGFELPSRCLAREKLVHFSLNNLRKKIENSSSSQGSASSSFSRAFRAKIAPGDQKDAEEELQREISKDMFGKMKVLGQFNLGFIITRLGSDLFIVDQHATDEKYNFEMLQRNQVLQSQKLICPQSLELPASSEIILMDNLDVFKKNGFDFLIDEEACPTERVKLVSAPVSKNWSFGKDDIEELLFMLTDSPNVMCRPSRVRMMFASRACRKSIMIGTALTRSQMRRLVCHMGEIEQPWNCPHGRPTMRHLFNLNMLPSHTNDSTEKQPHQHDNL